MKCLICGSRFFIHLQSQCDETSRKYEVCELCWVSAGCDAIYDGYTVKINELYKERDEKLSVWIAAGACEAKRFDV